MAEKLFPIEIMTPERLFLRHEVSALVCAGDRGEFTVLAGHAPMVAALTVGEMRIKLHGEWRSVVCSEGFLEVRPDKVLVFAQSLEWPDEIDTRRAEEAKLRAEEKLRQKQSLYEHIHTEASLARAMVRLRVGGGAKPGKRSQRR